MPAILRSVSDLSCAVAAWKAAGDSVGLVPTMGALHDGHLSLARAAKAGCDRVVVMIFVNPAQFGDGADLALYPRTEAADAALLAPLGIDAIFAPGVEAVYPPGFATRVSVTGLSDAMEGAFRPGHFEGVATVVAKLFGMAQADQAYFGEKDWQQLQVIRRMALDLNLATAVVGCPTMREADGLALSSRNARLGPKDRTIAPALHRAMQAVATARGAPEAIAQARSDILLAGFASVDYLDLRDASTLEPVHTLERPARLLAAATLGGVRLIDNIPV